MRVAVHCTVRNEKAAARILFEILGVHRHVANQEQRTPIRMESIRHERAELKPLCFRQSVQSVAVVASENRVRMRSAWLGSGYCGCARPVEGSRTGRCSWS